MRPFATASLSATTSSSRAALAAQGDNVVVRNLIGGSEAFFVLGDSSVVATTSGTPIAPGEIATYGRLPEETHIAVITASGSATVRATTGQGV